MMVQIQLAEKIWSRGYMSLNDEIKRAASEQEARRRQDQADKAAANVLSREIEDALARLGQDVVKECRTRNRRMVGEFSHTFIKHFIASESVQFALTRKGWQLGWLFIDEKGHFFVRRGMSPGERDSIKYHSKAYERDIARALAYHDVHERTWLQGPLVPVGSEPTIRRGGHVELIDGRLWWSDSTWSDSGPHRMDMLKYLAAEFLK